MPSPFPGMDPYIEGQRWEDFHHTYIEAVRESLVPGLRPRYAVRVEERVYLEHVTDSRDHIRPDITIVDDGTVPLSTGRSSGTMVAVPVAITLPMPEENVEYFLTIRDNETQDVVTVIEVLSPSNKRMGSDGRTEYLRKREEVLTSRTNLVEIDLLRDGEKLPLRGTQPQCDYEVIVSRRKTRPRGDAYPFFLRQQLPVINIPLLEGDQDVKLDLQSAFTAAYDRAGYDYSLKYNRDIDPPLSDEDAAWTAKILTAKS